MSSNDITPGIQQRGRTFYAEVPTYRNSPFSRYEPFDDLESAIAWRDAALIAIDAVNAAPDPNDFRDAADIDVPLEEDEPVNIVASAAASEVCMTVENLVDTYLDSLSTRGLPMRATKQAAHMLGHYLVDALGDEAAASVTEADIRDIRDALDRRGLSALTIQRILGHIDRVFAHAFAHSLIETNPFPSRPACSSDLVAGPRRRTRAAAGIYRIGNTYRAQVPLARGSARNKIQTFHTLGEATAWRGAALAALRPAAALNVKPAEIDWAGPAADGGDDG